MKPSHHWSMVTFLSAMILALCLSAEAQSPQQIYKVGRLSAGSPSDPLSKATYDAFREGMRELGWIESRNIVFEIAGRMSPRRARPISRPSWFGSRLT